MLPLEQVPRDNGIPMVHRTTPHAAWRRASGFHHHMSRHVEYFPAAVIHPHLFLRRIVPRKCYHVLTQWQVGILQLGCQLSPSENLLCTFSVSIGKFRKRSPRPGFQILHRNRNDWPCHVVTSKKNTTAAGNKSNNPPRKQIRYLMLIPMLSPFQTDNTYKNGTAGRTAT